MKRLIILSLVCMAIFTTSLVAEEAKADPNQKKLDKKLGSKFMKAVSWTADFDKALKRAKEESKPIFAYFTRSYSP